MVITRSARLLLLYAYVFEDVHDCMLLSGVGLNAGFTLSSFALFFVEDVLVARVTTRSTLGSFVLYMEAVLGSKV